MNYDIIGVSIQKQITVKSGRVFPPNISSQSFRVFVAWQSNLPERGFMWRCTEDYVPNFPNEADIQTIAARGYDCKDKNLVKKIFPHLPGKNLTD